eukprot:5823153-Pleurochrysis_carterae.AAC.1
MAEERNRKSGGARDRKKEKQEHLQSINVRFTDSHNAIKANKTSNSRNNISQGRSSSARALHVLARSTDL